MPPATTTGEDPFINICKIQCTLPVFCVKSGQRAGDIKQLANWRNVIAPAAVIITPEKVADSLLTFDVRDNV